MPADCPLIISLQEGLGYLKSLGCCNGFAVRWLEARLVDEEALFENRMNDIRSYGYSLVSLIDAVKEKKGLNLTEEDRKILDIHAFLDHLELQHSPERYTLLFGRFLSQSDTEFISSIATSDTMQNRCGLSKIYSEPGVYTIEEIQKNLDELRTTIDNSTIFLKETWGILLSGIDHTVALSYRSEEGWRFMDANHYPPLPFRKEETYFLSGKIADSLKLASSNAYIGFNTSIFTTGDNLLLPKMTNLLNQFKEKHVLTKDRFERELDQYDLTYIITQNKHASILSECIANYGLRLDKCYGDYTLLYLAVSLGDADIVELLCSNGVDPNLSNQGFTPIYLAAIRGDVASIKVLARQAADLNQGHEKGGTPIYAAACNDHLSAVIELAEQGANVNLGDKAGGRTPLHIATEKNSVNMLTALIKHGANGNLGDNNGVTPLHIAVTQNNSLVISELLNYGADPNRSDGSGILPIHIAAAYNDVDIIAELARHRANLNTQDNNGLTPFHVAIAYRNIEAIIQLAKCGANINKDDRMGRSPVFFAAQEGYAAAVEALIDVGADPSLSYTATVNDLRTFAGQHENNIVERMDYFLKQNRARDDQKIAISPYEIAYIMNNNAVINFLSPKGRRKLEEIEMTFFPNPTSKKAKNESPRSNKENSSLLGPKC